VVAFKILSEHFWALAILVTCVNTGLLKYRAKKRIENEPELAEGYPKLILGYLIWLNIPWIVMGAGCIFGGDLAVWHYFRPRDGNPFVLTWWASVFALWILSFIWVFFRGGAEILSKYQMIPYQVLGKVGYVTNPTKVKLLYLLCLAGGVIAAAIMWTVDVPLPKFNR
jgi:hypothetical protein